MGKLPFTVLPPAQPRKLHDYQQDVVDRLDAACATAIRRALLVMPTGSGKTIVAAEIARRAVADGQRVLFLVHKRELIGQSSRKLTDATIIDHGIVAAGFAASPDTPALIGMIPTLHARAMRSRKMDLPPADLVIVDEAHHATAASWRRIVEAYPNALVLGATATPCRKSGAGLGHMFQALVEGPQIAELIALRRLVGTLVYAALAPPDLKGVKTKAGDFVEAQLADRVDRPKLVGDVVVEWFRHAKHQPTIAFAVSVAHSVHIRDAFRAEGVLAEHIDGTTPGDERDRILNALANGTVDVVSNCAVLTEGFDCPNVGCIILARPTKSFGLYRQMVGRGLRVADGKPHCIVLDHGGCTALHDFVEAPALWSLDVASRAQTTAAAKGTFHHRQLRDCPECGALGWEGTPCRACGWRAVPKPKPIETVDQDLALVQRDGTRQPYEQDRRGFYRELKGVRIQRHFKPGWENINYKKKFGDWPPWSWRDDMPVEPSTAVRRWAQSRLIAYAKRVSR